MQTNLTRPRYANSEFPLETGFQPVVGVTNGGIGARAFLSAVSVAKVTHILTSL